MDQEMSKDKLLAGFYKPEVKKFEKSELYHIVVIGDKELRLFKSICPARLTEETWEEYRMRRKYVNDTIKKHNQYGYKTKTTRMD